MAASDIRVLIAADDRRVHAALADLFNAASGFRVAASGAPEALVDGPAPAADIGLIDILPPDAATGLDLVRRLSRTHRVPVLVLGEQLSLRRAALAAGAVAFLDKDSTPSAVLDAVRDAAATPMMLTDDVVYPESPRWRDGLLWFSDVHDYAVKTVDSGGTVRTVVEVPGRPAGLGFLPDGRLLIAGALDRTLRAWDGHQLTLVADLSECATGLLNDMVVDSRGRAFVGDTGFNLMAGEAPRPGHVFVFDDGNVRTATADVEFPNGAAVSPDEQSYWVAETSANRIAVFDIATDGTLSNKRILTTLPALPDGLCLDAEGAIWVALLTKGEFWRIQPDGGVAATVSAEGRLAVSCVLGGTDRRTLFLCSAATTIPELAQGRSTGLIHTRPAIPGAGWP